MECIIVFISTSVIVIIFMVGKFPGNESLIIRVYNLFSLLVECLFFSTCYKEMIEGIEHFFLGTFNF
jgi:hypothetical protein